MKAILQRHGDDLTLASVHAARIVLLVSVFAPTFGTPRTRIEIASSLKPEFSDFLRFAGYPGESFAGAPSLLAWNSNTVSCQVLVKNYFKYENRYI